VVPVVSIRFLSSFVTCFNVYPGRAVVHNGGYTSRLWVPRSGAGIKRHTSAKARASPPMAIPSEVSEGSDSEPPMSERQRDAQVA
jgi:hypothetical protein